MISLRNKIGQMLIMGFSGAVINEHSEVVHWLKKDGLGGVLLFDFDVFSHSYGRNLINQGQIKQLIHDLDFFSHFGSTQTEVLPLLKGIDYEGGYVDRLAKIEGCMETLPACEQAKLAPDAFDEEIREMAENLNALGFNLNFAPVVDLDLNQQDGIIGTLGRSFSSDPEIVTQKADRFVEIFNQYGIACAYKHFPGHGSADGDTHEGLVDISNSFEQKELLPYRRLEASYKPVMVMTAHVICRQLDDSGLPATLSHKILTGILRKKLGFDSVIVSDDLQMRAISNHYSLEERVGLAINAGADMLIFANQFGSLSAIEIIDTIERLVQEEVISSSRIDEAYGRIVRLKKELVLNKQSL